MPTSELSDALNPNVVRQRNYDNVLVYQDQQVHDNPHHQNFYHGQQQQPQYEYVPHRSELELAVVEPTPAQRYVPMLLTHLPCSKEFTGHDLPPSVPPGISHGYGGA